MKGQDGNGRELALITRGSTLTLYDTHGSAHGCNLGIYKAKANEKV